MKKSRFTEQNIIGVLRQAEAGDTFEPGVSMLRERRA